MLRAYETLSDPAARAKYDAETRGALPDFEAMARDAFGVTPGRDHTCTAFCCCEGGARRASPFEAEDLRKQRPFPLHGERRPGARPRAAPPMAPEVWVSAPAASAKNFAELQDMHDRARRASAAQAFEEARGAGVFGLSSVQTMHGVGTQLGDDERHALLHSRHLHHPESDGGGDSALDGQAGGASLARALFGEEPPSGVLFGCDVLKENCGCCLELEEMISLKCAPAPAAQHGAPCRAAWCAGHSRDALQDGPENSSGHARAGTSRQPRRSSAAA